MVVVGAESRRQMPIDAQPVPNGNIEPIPGRTDEVRVVKPEPEVERFVSHFATCPDAKGWKR